MIVQLLIESINWHKILMQLKDFTKWILSIPMLYLFIDRNHNIIKYFATFIFT